MGYYTSFQIKLEGIQPDMAKLVADFSKITGYDDNIFTSGEDVKWYKCDKDMLELSKLYPSTIFHIWRNGEKSDDNWHMVFCNGEFNSVQAELVYPPIDVKSIGDIGNRHPEFFL